MDKINRDEIPIGLGMALSQNQEAMAFFASLTKAHRDEIINHTHSIGSSEEMQEYVDSLTGAQKQ